MTIKIPPICPYCGNPSIFTSSKEVYGGRDFGSIYLCRPCWAYVGVHKGTTTPLGRLADAELREMKKKVHAAFDPLWSSAVVGYDDTNKLLKRKVRSAAYGDLSKLLNIPVSDCHVGMFDVKTCESALAALQDTEAFVQGLRKVLK